MKKLEDTARQYQSEVRERLIVKLDAEQIRGSDWHFGGIIENKEDQLRHQQ